jgi:beta-barrel assembly-enhancing protease
MIARAAAAALALLLVCGAVQGAPARPHRVPEPDLLPLGYQPPPNSDEAGLWLMSEQAEKSFKTSPLLVRDAALNAYVKGVVCKLVPGRCDAIRVYILDMPYFNAAMMPNGVMQVWTGLLLRAHNEAQLAFILGHEISHYTHRHSINQWRRLRNTSTFLAFFSLAAAGAGVGIAGSVAQLAAVGALLSYSRDEESEADAAGEDLAIAAGYDPAEAGKLWQEEGEEEKADPVTDREFAFLRTHPESKDRMQTLTGRAEKAKAAGGTWELGEDPYHHAVAPLRAVWFEEDLALGKYERSLCLLRRLAVEDPDSALVRFYIGEVHRRRNGKGDSENAMAAYRQAVELGPDKGMPVAAWRGLGLVAMKAGDKAGARDAFTHYLAAAPQAGDRAMVELYLNRVQEPSQ